MDLLLVQKDSSPIATQEFKLCIYYVKIFFLYVFKKHYIQEEKNF